MKSTYLLPLFATTLTIAPLAQADSSRPDDHAPISVMGDHTHKAGEWMMSYRYMDMKMSGNYVDSNEISTSDVLDSYMVAPLEMDMKMRMVGVMYAPTDDVTLMAMVNYLDNDMDHVTRMGMNFETATSGLGDSSISALVNIQKTESRSTHYQVGVSIPTGDIKERGNTPMGNVRLPYPMQLGSGTYDAILGVTHKEFFDNSSWGIQAKSILRTGENDLDYRLGNKFELTSWYAYNLSHQWSTSFGVKYTNQRDIKGADSALNPMMVATAVPKLRAGYFWDINLGLNFNLHNGNRLGLELTKTAHQSLDGPQLGRDWSLTLGWQYAF